MYASYPMFSWKSRNNSLKLCCVQTVTTQSHLMCRIVRSQRSEHTSMIKLNSASDHHVTWISYSPFVGRKPANVVMLLVVSREEHRLRMNATQVDWIWIIQTDVSSLHWLKTVFSWVQLSCALWWCECGFGILVNDSKVSLLSDVKYTIHVTKI